MRRYGISIGLAVILICALCGCGRTGREELEGIYQTDNRASETDAQQNAENSGQAAIPEHESYVVDGEAGGTYTVEADVMSKGYGNTALYEVAPKDMNDDDIAAYAGAMFDDGKYERVKPYKICSMEELLAEQVFLQEQGVEEWDEYFTFIDIAMLNYDEGNAEEYPEGQLIYTDDAGEECMLRGYVNGELWIFHYVQRYGIVEGYPTLTRNSEIVMRPLRRSGPSLNACTYEEMDAVYAENMMNYEEACSLAEDKLTSLGLSDMELLISWQISYVEDKQIVFDGYKLVYTREIDGILGMYSENDLVMSDEVNGASQEFVRVYITSEGLVRLEYMAPLEVKETISENVSLLGYDQISGLAQTYMREHSGNYKEKINAIEFRHAVMYYDEKYVMMPVWVFYQDMMPYYRTIDFAVNAVTGEFLILEQAPAFLIQ